MNCPACGVDNRAGRRFCRKCGAALENLCAACGAANQEGDGFCGECGAALAGAPPRQSVSAPALANAGQVRAAERRHVSVLFADLVGFTALSQQRDAEDVRELLGRYFDTARTVITRHGGTVEKFIGDAVMAAWGVQAIQENDAERAVRAALELVDAVAAFGEQVGAPGLRARAGVLSLGQVTKVVDLIGLVREHFRPGRQPSMDAHILRWEARMAAERIDNDGAAAKFRAAIDAFATLQRPFWLAVTRLELAEWLLAQGRDAEAEKPLAQARATFEELRAAPWLNRVVRSAVSTMASTALPA